MGSEISKILVAANIEILLYFDLVSYSLAAKLILVSFLYIPLYIDDFFI